MATSPCVWQPTPRDDAILAALELLPLKTDQLQKWSQRFASPFSQIDDLRRRLRKLRAAGLVRRWPMAIASRGPCPHYYKLTPAGYRFLHRDDTARPDRKRAFAPIGRALHYHAVSLSDFIVHAGVSAMHLGIEFTHLFPENAYRIEIGDESLRLDWRFSLLSDSARRTYNIELDNSTENILSVRHTDSIGRKIRLLDADDAQFDSLDPRRAFTLFITTQSRTRLTHILDTAASLVRNPDRSLIYGVYLPDFLQHAAPLIAPCFLDHRLRPVALFPNAHLKDSSFTVRRLATPVVA